MSDRTGRASAQQPPITNHTKFKEQATGITGHHLVFSENCTQEKNRELSSRVKISLLPFDKKKKVIKPHDRLVLVRYTDYSACTPNLSTRWSSGGL